MIDRPDGNGGFLDRLRANETLRRITGGRPDIAIFGVPAIVVLAVAGLVVGVLAASGGGGDDAQATGRTPTAAATTPPATATPGANIGLLTPIPLSEGDLLTDFDLAQRGAGIPPRGDFLGDRLIVPSIGIDAPFTYRQVPASGQMPNPDGPEDVAYYDFGQWPGLGGLPGQGGNVVLAGHVDYIDYGQAVFWDLGKLKIGDRIQIRMKDGSVIEYQVEFNKHIDAGNANWEAIVAGTEQESITLITCSGEFSAGHYNNRQIVWGRRVV